MKLVTFETADGVRRPGLLEGEEVVAFRDVADMRALYERGLDPRAAADGGERFALADVRICAPIVPKKFFHTAGNFREHEEESKVVNWSHEIAPWIVFFQNVDAIIGPDDPIIYPEHLTDELDYELEIAVVIGKRRQVLRRRGGRWTTSPATRSSTTSPRATSSAGDAVRRVLLLQGDRHLLPDRAVDRHPRRGRRPAQPGDGAARQRRGPPGLPHGPHVGRRSPRSSRTTRRWVTAPATSSPPAPSRASPGFSEDAA